MSAVVAGTLAKLDTLLPGRIGDNKAYTTSYVTDLIMAGFYEVADKCGVLNVTQDITLTQDTLLYDLSSSFITVEYVEFKSDGSNVDGHLKPVTLRDLDLMSRKWRDDRGTRPEFYSLLSTPGTQNLVSSGGAQIQIRRPMSSVDSEIITVTGLGIGDTSTNMPDDIQRLALVPYVMSHLKAVAAPQEAVSYYKMFKDGCDRVRGRYGHRYEEALNGGRP